MKKEIVWEIWGDFACFSRPESKVERLTYPVPTPSAMRGALSAIYSKPAEFYWQINRIEVLNPLQYISFKRNEVKEKIPRDPNNPILADATNTGNDQKGRTQRQTVALKDVHYRVSASICKRPNYPEPDSELYKQARRRIKQGKCFYQPSLGLREFAAFFEESDGKKPPIDLDLDLGYMVYDVFDLHKYRVTERSEPYVTLFHATLKRGVLEIPPFDSEAVLKPEVM